MTNEQIVTIALAIVVAIVSALSKSIFDKIFAQYNPDIKKMKSRIIFFIMICFRFIIPFVLLIILYFNTESIDKIFIVSFTSIFFILIFNIFYDIFKRYVDKKNEKQIEFQASTVSFLIDLIEKENLTQTNILKLSELLNQHIQVTSKMLDKK